MSDHNRIVAGLEAGANDYMVKLFYNEELCARIRVGSRMLELQERLREHERAHGFLQMAASVCHEINQPLQSLLIDLESLSWTMDSSHPNFKTMLNMQESIKRLGGITQRIMDLNEPKIFKYLHTGQELIDFHV